MLNNKVLDMSKRKRYVVVGTGGRSGMYIHAVVGKYSEVAELVGLCDMSRIRMQWYNDQLKKSYGIGDVAMYHSDDFDVMIKETKADVVVVTTVDCWHHKYIVRAMELGCDVITEKPMTTDAEKARAIFDAIEQTGKELRVTFNCRYMPFVEQVKGMLNEGIIGEITSVDMTWLLDTSHGADYFRRWHGEKDISGGLQLHKSTHHFDMVNWWIDSYPKTVFAMGDLRYYGKKNAEARGEKYSYDRYTGHEEAKEDPFYMDLTSGKMLKGLYYEAEKDSGYIRDRNVFNDKVTSEDTLSVTARYRNGVIFGYTLVAYSPWEGYRVAFTGTKGRLEVFDQAKPHVVKKGEGDKGNQALGIMMEADKKGIHVFPMFGEPYEVDMEVAKGSHGGGDTALLSDIFATGLIDDPLGRAATHIDGAASILMGIGINESMASGKAIDVDELLRLPYEGE